MNCITAKEFLKQGKKAQNELINWWKMDETDIVGDVEYLGDFGLLCSIAESHGYSYPHMKERFKRKCCIDKQLYVPLFSETQLRQYIEEKSGLFWHMERFQDDISKNYYYALIINGKTIKTSAKDLLEAYWQIVCKIIQEQDL